MKKWMHKTLVYFGYAKHVPQTYYIQLHVVIGAQRRLVEVNCEICGKNLEPAYLEYV
jgi:hypothetical protein